MLFGPDRVVACPGCSAPLRVFTLRTANNLGATRWTDGFVSMPGWAQPPPITRCPSCRAFHWPEDAAELGYLPERPRFRPWGDVVESEPEPEQPTVPEEWVRAPRVRDLAIDELLEAIHARAWGPRGACEIALRTLAWQASSHSNRNPRRKKDRQKTPADRRNMEALLALHAWRFEGTGDEESALVCAEIHRQLGYFRAAVEVLERAPPRGELAPLALRIRELATGGNVVVARWGPLDILP